MANAPSPSGVEDTKISDDKLQSGRTPWLPWNARLLTANTPEELTSRTLRESDAMGVLSHQCHAAVELKPVPCHELLLTHCGVGTASREASLLNSARREPSAILFSLASPTSVFDARNTLSVTVSEPPPSTTVLRATVRAVGNRAALMSADKCAKKPAIA
jgi:hypothetical protein